jgi:hypothetical protein
MMNPLSEDDIGTRVVFWQYATYCRAAQWREETLLAISDDGCLVKVTGFLGTLTPEWRGVEGIHRVSKEWQPGAESN